MDHNWIYIWVGVPLAIFAMITANLMENPLRKKYCAYTKFNGTWSNFQKMFIGRVALDRFASLGFDKDFLYIEIMSLPKNFELQIPWSAIRSIEKQTDFYVFSIEELPELRFFRNDTLEKALAENTEAVKLLNYSNLRKLG